MRRKRNSHAARGRRCPGVCQPKPLETTAGWKTACETSPGNRVVLDQDTTVNVGASASAPLQVTTGCTIEMINDAEITFDKVGLSFAGPLTISGGFKSGVAMQEASLAAPSVNISLPSDEGYIRTSFSRIDATAGDMTVTLGRIAKMELFQYRFRIGPGGPGTGGTNGTFAASGNLTVSAGDKLSATMNESVFLAGGSVTFNGNGAESELKVENSAMQATAGNLLVILRSPKSKLEAGNSALRAGADLDFATGQSESGVNLSNVTVNAGARVQIYGAGNKSEVKLSNGSVNAGGGIFISAAAGSTEGSLSVENGAYNATTPIRFITGAQGKTIVKDARITGTGLVDINTAPGSGVCEALGNRITAPQQQLCN
jgi:hypothetical protein